VRLSSIKPRFRLPTLLLARTFRTSSSPNATENLWTQPVKKILLEKENVQKAYCLKKKTKKLWILTHHLQHDNRNPDIIMSHEKFIKNIKKKSQKLMKKISQKKQKIFWKKNDYYEKFTIDYRRIAHYMPSCNALPLAHIHPSAFIHFRFGLNFGRFYKGWLKCHRWIFFNFLGL